MKKLVILSAVSIWLVASVPVRAEGYADVIVAELQQQGYSSIQTNVTWLGRVRISAVSDKGTREIILNPRTGEILRDLWLLKDGEAARGADSPIIGNDDDSSDDDSSDDSSDDDSSDDSGGGDDSSDDSGGDDD